MVKIRTLLESPNPNITLEIEKLCLELLDPVIQNKLFSSQIFELVFTDNLESFVKDLNKLYPDLHHKLTKEREYITSSTTIKLEKGVVLAFNLNVFIDELKNSNINFLELVLQVKSCEEVSKYINLDRGFNDSSSFSDIVELLFGNWATVSLAHTYLEQLNFKSISNLEEEVFVGNFKRNIKKHHAKYQGDLDIFSFWESIILTLDQFVRRSLELKYNNSIFNEFQEFQELIPHLITEIEYQTKNINDNNFDLSALSKQLKRLLEACYVKIAEENPLNVRITKNPITLFKGTLVDTEQRIVAFIDILGFSEIIKEYDSNETSNQLKDLKKALDDSINGSIEQILNQNHASDIKEILEYKMFSDCICISIPFIDSFISFQTNFNYMAVIVKSYQLAMLMKGYYLRGGISLGSYYSDSNMIFSGGLVSAYKIETQVNVPIIGVDQSVFDRFNKNYSEFKSYNLPFDFKCVYPVLNEDLLFLNPFDLLDDYIGNIDYIKSNLTELSGIDNSNSAVLELSKEIFTPLFKYASSVINDEYIMDTKKLILANVTILVKDYQKKFDSCPFFERLFVPFNFGRKTKAQSINNVLQKYIFLKYFIEWSMGLNNNFKNKSQDNGDFMN